MGRAGGGGGGRSGGGHTGGGRAGGGFSGGGRAGGGHTSSGFGRTSSGSSGRAGAGSNMGGAAPRGGAGGMGNPGGGMGGRGFRNAPPPRGPRRGFWGRFRPFWGGGGYYRGGGCGGCMTAILVLVIIIVLGVFSFTSSSGRKNQKAETTVENTGSSSSSSSSSSREKIDTDLVFDSNCILDELGWFEDADAAGESLEDFFNATGVQPYIYFMDYDESLTTDSEKEEYAQQWYEDNIDNEGTFLFIYFAEEDTDNDIGYMYYVCGYDIESVMDEEACEIFWDYVDEYWYSDLSTDDMITEIFNSLADAIM